MHYVVIYRTAVISMNRSLGDGQSHCLFGTCSTSDSQAFDWIITCSASSSYSACSMTSSCLMPVLSSTADAVLRLKQRETLLHNRLGVFPIGDGGWNLLQGLHNATTNYWQRTMGMFVDKEAGESSHLLKHSSRETLFWIARNRNVGVRRDESSEHVLQGQRRTA